ncbi:RNA-binding S4 domain-containing protein [Amorphus sp. 3PC139-8]|uniref:RNA-binding S4 domain-containing protein n=1 Tax=Amorphus sp. 3PC139-8 TaxID=2735676 RepID=UPI00345D8FA6
MTRAEVDEASSRQRIDVWLWRIRAAKTRGLAQTLVTSGHVRVNREKVKASSRRIGPGDVVTIAGRHAVRVLEVICLPERRGPAPEAHACYRDLSAPANADERGDRAETSDADDED